jgi:hypothetical protein
MTEPDLRYPIGKFKPETSIAIARRNELIEQIADTPAILSAAVEGLADKQLDTPYRPDGWTVRQVVHHLADSHMNSYIRFKLALTEDNPTIRPYDEKKWAELDDARAAPIEVSLSILETLHRRWAMMLRAMTPSDFDRKLTHPEIGDLKVDTLLQIYAWHGRHHVAHITALRERMAW